MNDYIRLMRPKHYIKNVLIFAPLFFSKTFYDLELIKETFLGFIAFSLISSFIYILNDLMDIENDRMHPVKKSRPLASGKVSINNAKVLAFILFIMSFSIQFFVTNSRSTLLFLSIYIVMNLVYSIKLKQIPIIDVTIIMLGFILRILYGGALVSIPLSNWLILTVMTFSYYLALGKRRNELLRNGYHARSVLNHYNPAFLDKLMYVMLSLFIVFYSLWSVSIMESSKGLIWSIPFVIVIVMRYSLILESNSFGDPADVIFSDRILIFLSLAYSFTLILMIYL